MWRDRDSKPLDLTENAFDLIGEATRVSIVCMCKYFFLNPIYYQDTKQRSPVLEDILNSKM